MSKDHAHSDSRNGEDAARRSWQEDVESILRHAKLGGSEAASAQAGAGGFAAGAQIDMRKSKIFSGEGGAEALAQFEKMTASGVAFMSYPAFFNLYMILYASRAAALDAGLSQSVVDGLFAAGVLRVQNAFMDALMAGVLPR